MSLPALESAFLDMQKIYMSDVDVGKVYGVSRQTVQKYRAKHNIPAVPDIHSQRNRDIIKMSKDRSCTEIAEIVGLSVGHVQRIVRNNKTNNN